jgi:hypothetical protein
MHCTSGCEVKDHVINGKLVRVGLKQKGGTGQLDMENGT